MVFADINYKGAQEAAEKSMMHDKNENYRPIAVTVDVTDLASVQDMVEKTVAEFGRIDYNVNSAGVRILIPGKDIQ